MKISSNRSYSISDNYNFHNQFCVCFRWNYDLSNPIKTPDDPNYDPTADYTVNLHPDMSTVGEF